MAVARNVKANRRLPDHVANCSVQLPLIPIDWAVHEVDQGQWWTLG